MKLFANRQQLGKVLRRMVSPALRDKHGDLIGEADLMVEIITQAVDDKSWEWFEDQHSFFPEICELLGFDVSETRKTVLNTNRSYVFRNNKELL